MKLHLSIASTLLCALLAQAQGTINFSNFALPNVVNDSLGGIPQPVSANIVFALYAGPQGTTAGSLVEVTVGNRATIDTLPGVFSAASDVIVGSVVPGAMGTFQVRAWDQTFGTTYETFLMNAPVTATRGESAVFDNLTGGVQLPMMPPGFPAALSNFPGMVLVPEPSTYALGAMGLGALAFLRRRKA